ncbi:unnamed protein product [Orchesella dallaii]|uniref:DUF5077 domain-containing protein n=1 Tax=Orchesella dallaii TaxID=48710 RepID=A0ABP1PPZ3_9HEXA
MPTWTIPYGGNAFIKKSSPSAIEVITEYGLGNWTSNLSIASLYFHSRNSGRVSVSLRLLCAEGTSVIKMTVGHNEGTTGGETRQINIAGSEYYLVNCGIFTISKPGYTRVDLQGVSRTGGYFGDVSHLQLVSESDSLVDPNDIKFVENPDDFYFGRRGPSVHLSYPLPEGRNCEYFYNEVFVPRQQDVVGAYFCAMGFNGGYFGIQVNSEQERRVLFSIWSEYTGGGETPEEYKVKLLRKGEDVYVGEFGNEGTGAQSYLRYMWQSEQTYKFIVKATPIAENRTVYTGWFNNGSSPNAWELIASFEKPYASVYFLAPYSFSENFVTEQGNLERSCIFSNQWALGTDSTWREVTDATLTADDTYHKGNRMDVAGGVGLGGDLRTLFLQNCGFFSDMVLPGSSFIRVSSGLSAPVDVSILP